MEGPGPVETGEDPLAIYRERISTPPRPQRRFSSTPFSVNAFVQGRLALGPVFCAPCSFSAPMRSPST